MVKHLFVCSVGKTNPLVDSSHDVLVSSLSLPCHPQHMKVTLHNKAPRVENAKHKVHWSEQGILDYQALVARTLPDVTDPEVASVLFQVTNHVLTEAAKMTNDFVELSGPPKIRKSFVPSEIKVALKTKNAALTQLNQVKSDPSTPPIEIEQARINFRDAKSQCQNLVRKHNVSKEVERDNDLLELLSKQPKDIFKSFKKTKCSQSAKIKSLKVGDNVFYEEEVADGFYESIAQLKL